MELLINEARMILIQGDITQENVDAIVNAANSQLRGGGGVDGAIHRAGGPAIMEACRKIGYCPAGKAVITTGGNLKAPWVIHTVGPIYRDGTKGESEILKSAYHESLQLASRRGLKSLAFPAISTGAYGYPLREAAEIALRMGTNYLRENSDIDEIRFVLYDKRTFTAFAEELAKLL